MSLSRFPPVIGARSLSMSDYLVGLESSGWLRHIKAVVDAANFLTKVSEVFHFAIHPLDPEILLSEHLKRSVM